MAKTNRLTGDFRKHLNKTYLGSWDIPEGSELVATIDHCETQTVKSERGESDEVVAIFKEKDIKPMILNKTNQTSISEATGSKKFEDWEGRAITLYVNPNVSAFGKTVEAVRIRNFAPRTNTIICTGCGSVITDHGTSKAKVIAERAMSRFGTYLCYDCAAERAAAEEAGGEE